MYVYIQGEAVQNRENEILLRQLLFLFSGRGGGDKIWKFDEHDKIASFEKLIFEKVKRNSISSKKILKIEIER